MSETRKRALCCAGSAALALGLLALGGAVGGALLLWPLLAMVALIPAAEEGTLLPALAAWAVSAALGLLLPGKEYATVYALVGYYAVLRPRVQRLSLRYLRMAAKVAVAVVSSALLYALLAFVYGAELLTGLEGREGLVLLVFLLAGGVYFLLYDFVLDRCGRLWREHLRRRLLKEE